MTRTPNACSPADVARLRGEGLADADVLGLVQIVAYFNMSNRIFEALSTVD